MIRFGSVCSGIEAASVAWNPLGWRASFFSEIEAFPRAVLQHHYPETPLHGDFTTIRAGEYGPIDLLVGGTPCQSFSVAGLRGGLGDDRGNLSLEYLRLADRLRPRWLVWENVPGVLSSNGGRDFGAILGGMVELGYGFAYRVLNSRYFGLAQQRRRVFVIGYLGDWRPPAAVLLEPSSLSGNPEPGRGGGEVHSARPVDRVGVAGRYDRGGTFGFALNQRGELRKMHVSGALAAEPGTKQQTYVAEPFAFTCSNQANGFAWERPYSPTLNAQNPTESSNIQQGVRIGHILRRFTPLERERLQGFPDHYTAIPYKGRMAPDAPRTKSLGNSMSPPVMRWIGERIAIVEALL